MKAKRRGRNVQELCNATDIIGEPKAYHFSVERESCRRGPLNETLKNDMESSQAEKGLGKPSMRRKVHTSTESGTCNVCFAPCSSCMHLNLACMGSKGDAFSDETCHVTASSQFSYNDGDGLASFKSRACDSLQHTTSEASNLLSVSSSHDSLSENAESKVNRKSSDADASAESHMHPKMTSGRAVAEDQFSPKAESFPDQKTFSKTHVDSKSEEGHDDNISCVSRANYASEVVSYHNKNLDMNNCLHSSALKAEGSGKALLSHKSCSFETPSNDVDAGSSSPKVQSKCLSSNANGKHLDEDPSLHDYGKQFECLIEQVNLSLSNEAAATIDCVGNLAAPNIADNQANGKSTLDADSSKVSCKINSKLELDADKDSGDQADEGFKCSDQIERKEKLNEPDELADIPMLQSASGDESDESEILEHDVKVCDICGDAGREDSLAICSRCADGAEHIYCMREMLQNLPEGDWLCEECKLIEEAENQKQDAEEKRMNVASTQNSGKRHAEPVELASAPKKQATETSLASPKSCSPSRIAAVSRDTSSNSLDKGKVKIGHQTSFGNKSCIDIPEIARPSVKGPRVQTLKGALLKSYSSNTLNSKLKAKLVDEVPQKHKGTRKSSFDMEEPGTMMRKSMSFKSVSSGRSSTNELKVKMLSSKFSQIQDSRGLKQVRDRDAVDRKKLSRLDRPLGSSMTSSAVVSAPKVDQRLTPRGESVIAPSTGNPRELKSAQSDGKLGTLLRSTSNVGCKGADTPVTSVRASSTNGISSNSMEQKLNQISPKDEPSSSSWNAERLSCNATENLQDGLPQSRESSNQGEKARENSLSHLRPVGITGLKNVICKNKEIGHATENCTAVSPLASGTDVSTSRIPRVEMSKGSKLKAVVAAMIKKPGIYRKKKEIDQSNGLSSSNVDESGEIASQDQLSVLNKMSEGTDEWQANIGTSTSEFCKSTDINNVKLLNEYSNDAVCSVLTKMGSDSIAPYLGKPVHPSGEKSVLTKMGSDSIAPYLGKLVHVSSSEFSKSTDSNNVKQPNEHSNDDACPFKVGSDSIALYSGKSVHASAEKSVLTKMSAIPEHEYIWQGVFEVRRAEKVIDSYSGIQAHLSTCASPKVLDVVSKFPQKINLDEVPRLSTWPRQFHVTGAKEENIALYFFAKNFESYENYKRLLDNMIKKDLALKGSFEGVEFFIFPSTQLPENSQRWNMLYFLWGVFRGSRSDFSDSFKKLVMPSLNGVPMDKDIPAAVMTSSENLCVPECIVKNTSACDSSSHVFLVANAPEKPSVSLNGNSDDKVFNSQTKLEKQDGKVDSRSLTKIPRSSTPWYPETRCNSRSLEEVGPPRCSLDVDPKPCTEVTQTNSGSDMKGIQVHEGASRPGEDMQSFKIFGVGSQNSGCGRIFGEDKTVDRTFSDRDNIIVERDLNEDIVNMDVETFSEKGPGKRPFLDLSDTAPLILSSMTQKAPWNKADNNRLVDGESISKKLKKGFGGLYGGSGSRDEKSLSGSFTSPTCDLGSSSSIEERSYDKASVEKVILEDLGTSERYFFPVDSHPVKDSRLPATSIPWNSSNDEDPNLELALGAETKPPNILPFFGMAEKNHNQKKPPDKVMNKEEDDDVSASLSLSLSFPYPFPDKEQTVKPVSKTVPHVPERCDLNTSPLLFRGLPDK
ncbi:Zinc finger, FYVE/PHD-type [Salix suchowensis]|nr:Zinc finger, FYVE/PHD-type [Salix suchowensis]